MSGNAALTMKINKSFHAYLELVSDFSLQFGVF